jgi:hypothetical protein
MCGGGIDDDLEILVDEDVVRPVDADVVDFVLAVAQLDDTVDDAVGGQCGFGRGTPAGVESPAGNGSSSSSQSLATWHRTAGAPTGGGRAPTESRRTSTFQSLLGRDQRLRQAAPSSSMSAASTVVMTPSPSFITEQVEYSDRVVLHELHDRRGRYAR